MVETSRSAKCVIASVRGIGVAVMMSWCGVRPCPFSRNKSRCATPNRCCSSMMAKPSRLNTISSWNRACVPMTIWQVPLLSCSSIVRRGCAFIEPVSHPTEMPSGWNHSENCVACCSDRSSVGAINATWKPASITGSAASAATNVFPEPTSPWRSRNIGCPRERS